MTTPTAPKKDFWAPFRTDLKTFLTQTRKASAAGATAAVGITGALVGPQISSGKLDAAAISADIFVFIGAFIAGFSAAYATSNS